MRANVPDSCPKNVVGNVNAMVPPLNLPGGSPKHEFPPTMPTRQSQPQRRSAAVSPTSHFGERHFAEAAVQPARRVADRDEKPKLQPFAETHGLNAEADGKQSMLLQRCLTKDERAGQQKVPQRFDGANGPEDRRHSPSKILAEDESARNLIAPQEFVAKNEPAGSSGALQDPTVVEELLNSNRLMLQQMQTLADAAQKAATAAEEAAQAAARKSDGFRSARSQEACEKGDGKTTEAEPTLTVERLREHARSHQAQQAESQNFDQFRQARDWDVWGPVGAWNLLHPIDQGVTEIELKNYSGLAIGEIVEIDFATNSAEVITIC